MKLFGQSGRPPRPTTLPEARGEKRPPGAVPPSARKPAIMQEPVLVLNATFEPINVTAVRRAMVLMIKGVAQAEEVSHTEVHSASRGSPCCPAIRDSASGLQAHPAANPGAFPEEHPIA